ncbi:MAG: uracil-DNA glycosylase [Metamycoplasmataceae bacterium]
MDKIQHETYFQNINNEWVNIINSIFKKNNLDVLTKLDILFREKNIYPSKENIFRCFSFFEPNKTKIVFIGQDPYFQPGIADGLCFSSFKDNKIPSSLKNIFKELENDLGICKDNPDLSSWAMQGILLLNTFLSVEEGKPLSCKKIGWDLFTKEILIYLNENYSNIIFVFFGKKSQKMNNIITNKNHVINVVHPSGLSASRGFFGSKLFSKINQYLSKNHKIIW